jgi:hypothetical protein
MSTATKTATHTKGKTNANGNVTDSAVREFDSGVNSTALTLEHKKTNK